MLTSKANEDILLVILRHLRDEHGYDRPRAEAALLFSVACASPRDRLLSEWWAEHAGRFVPWALDQVFPCEPGGPDG